MDQASMAMATQMARTTQKPTLYDLGLRREYCHFTLTELAELLEQEKSSKAAA